MSCFQGGSQAGGGEAAGNLTSWGGYAYNYNIHNELRAVQGGGNDWVCIFTADGERLWPHNVATNASLHNLPRRLRRVVVDSAWCPFASQRMMCLQNHCGYTGR